MSKIEIEIPNGKELKFNPDNNCYEIVDIELTMDYLYRYYQIKEDVVDRLFCLLHSSEFAYWKLGIIARYFNQIPVVPTKDTLYTPRFKITDKGECIYSYVDASLYPNHKFAIIGASISYLRKEDAEKSAKLFPEIWRDYLIELG